MKKTGLVLLFTFLLVFSIFGEEQKKVYHIDKAYSYKDASQLISESDINCSYFIRPAISEDIVLVGAKEMDLLRKEYSDGDELYINKGSKDGLKEGDQLLIISKGKRITNPLRSSSLGIYYLKKSLAKITCIYEDQAVIELMNGCHPVWIGDFAIPYKPGKTLFKKLINYKSCRLPESEVIGNVVYINIFMNFERAIAGPSEYVSVDLGREMVSYGDFLLFYKYVKKNLPPVITGVGIVISAQNTNATVKVLDASYPVQVGSMVRLLPSAAIDETQKEQIPTINAEQKEERQALKDEQVLELEILFNIDEAEISSSYQQELAKINDFISSKSEYVIVLRGYTCSIGNEEYNLKLSEKRVEIIKAYLMKQYKISEEFFETYFYGEKSALYDNSEEIARRKNRMVSIQVIGK